jgi:hypothetical protein
MALNDNAVVTAAQGYIFVATNGTAAPTPAELEAADPVKFGSLTVNIEVSGTPTSYTLVVGGTATTAIPLASTAAQVQAVLEATATVGEGNVLVEGVGAADAEGLDITFVGALQGVTVTVVEGTYVGGTSPDTVITTVTAVNGWKNIGHTSRDDLPEFGFDGGDSEVKGTWQNSKLREVVSETPADFLTINLNQIDRTALELYYGADSAATAGVFGVDGDVSQVNERAVLVIIVDGDVKIGFYAPKASVKRDDSIELSVDEFAALPIKATFLKMTGRRIFDWINEDLFA